jgi:cell division protein FtsL
MAKERLSDDAEEPRKGRGSRAQAKARGRAIVGTLLIGFVLVASAVIWRRSYGVQLSRDLADLDRRQTQLEGERARLRSLIRDESSRSRLAPTVERLGMKVPSDKQVRILPR